MENVKKGGSDDSIIEVIMGGCARCASLIYLRGFVFGTWLVGDFPPEVLGCRVWVHGAKSIDNTDDCPFKVLHKDKALHAWAIQSKLAGEGPECLGRGQRLPVGHFDLDCMEAAEAH